MTTVTDKTSGRIFYASPWLLAAASLLLALIIVVFAVNNFQREKELMTFAMVQEGQAVLNLVSSSSRTAVRGEMMRGDLSSIDLVDIIRQVIESSSEHQGIVSLSVVKEGGEVVVTSGQHQLKNRLDESTVDFLRSLQLQKTPALFRIITKLGTDEEVFQIAALFQPFMFKKEMPLHMREMSRGRMSRGGRDAGENAWQEPSMRDLLNTNYFLIAELDMSDYRQSVRRQFVQLVILSFVMLLVGVGSLLSLIMLKGFKGSQLRLKRMSAFTDVLISEMPVGIIAIDADGIVRTCNPSSCSILGITYESVLGYRADQVLPEPLSQLFTKKEVNQHELSGIELTCIVGTVEKNLHVVRVTIEHFAESRSGNMLILQDLTTQKKLERELRRNERHAALGKMAAGVAHELRNPLSSIKGLALLLKSKLHNTVPGEEAADVLVSEVERLDRSISELLNYTRQDILQLQQVHVKELIRKALVLVNTDVVNAGIKIEQMYEPDNLLIKGDPDKLTQVLLNILLNSLQATDSGGTIHIAVTIHHEMANIVVRDNGAGIEPQHLERIFDPYFTTKNDGTGLGLSLSSKIVEDHHGSIAIESVEGVGTTVTVSLPL